jgi:acyl-CoA synthetase (NDP forming)
MSQDSLDFIFYPKSIAVVGASNNIESHGHNHMNFQLSYGFSGEVYPINPKQTEILGHKVYPSLEDVPGTVDHVIVAVAIHNIPDIVTQAGRKGVKSMHIYSGRASETGRPEAKKLDEEILRRAKQHGIRILGPNALGIFCPKSGLAFGYDFPEKPGNVGAMMQSGANSTDLCHFALHKGIRFSKVVSYGNALDINEVDLFQYFTDDSETQVLLCYIEGFRCAPEKYLELVRKAMSKKPVIICHGGRTKAGTRFSAGHNASKSEIGKEIWEGPIQETGAILVRDIDELLDMAVAFSFLPPIRGYRVGTGGGGGGNCALNSDAWEENGFELPPLPQEIREEFKRRGSELWDWINNPADFSITAPGDAFTVPAALAEMAKHPDFDFIVGYVGEDFPFKVETLHKEVMSNVEAYIKVSKEFEKPFFAISRDRSLGIREFDGQRHRIYAQARTRLLEEGIPFFTSVDSAAKAIKKYIKHCQSKGL